MVGVPTEFFFSLLLAGMKLVYFSGGEEPSSDEDLFPTWQGTTEGKFSEPLHSLPPNNMQTSRWIGCVVWALCILTVAANRHFQIKVEPKSEDCFYMDYDVGVKVEFEWQVLDGGLLDVDVRVRSPPPLTPRFSKAAILSSANFTSKAVIPTNSIS